MYSGDDGADENVDENVEMAENDGVRVWSRANGLREVDVDIVAGVVVVEVEPRFTGGG